MVRAIYAAQRTAGAGALVLAGIERVGRALDTALGLAARSRDGTVGMRAAWAWAEEATRNAASLVQMTDPAGAHREGRGARVRHRSA